MMLSPVETRHLVDVPMEKKWTINVISGAFIEVYTTQISGVATLGKRLCEHDDVAISFSEVNMEHVTNFYDDPLMITVEIDVYDVKNHLVDSDSSRDIFFSQFLYNPTKNEK